MQLIAVLVCALIALAPAFPYIILSAIIIWMFLHIETCLVIGVCISAPYFYAKYMDYKIEKEKKNSANAEQDVDMIDVHDKEEHNKQNIDVVKENKVVQHHDCTPRHDSVSKRKGKKQGKKRRSSKLVVDGYKVLNGSVKKDVVVTSAGILVVNGILTGNVTVGVGGDLEINGLLNGDVRIKAGAGLLVNGMIDGDVYAEEGADIGIMGMVNGIISGNADISYGNETIISEPPYEITFDCDENNNAIEFGRNNYYNEDEDDELVMDMMRDDDEKKRRMDSGC